VPRNSKTNKRFPARALFVIAGLALLGYILERAGFTNLLHSLVALHWTLLLIIVLGGVSHAMRTLGWRLALGDHRGGSPFIRLAGLRLAAEAGGQLGFVGQMFGDTMRITLLRDRIPVDVLISSVTCDRGLYMVTGAIVSAGAVAAATFALPLPHGFMIWARLFVAVLVGFLLISARVIRKRLKILSATARFMSRLPRFATWIEKRLSGIHATEEQLTRVLTEHPRAFWTAFVLNLGSHFLAVVEVYLILLAFGLKGGWLAAFSMEALTKLINVVGAINPGNIGTYEGGNMLMLKLFGISASLGLTFAAARRLRALFWAAVGSIFLIAFARVGQPKRAASGESTPTTEESETPANGHLVCVVVANDPGDSSRGLKRVGTLPVVLRAILSLRKSAAGRIFVLVDQTHGSEIRRVLMKTGRVPKSVEWVTTPTGTPLSHSLQDILKQTTAHRLVIVSGARTYHPSVVRRAVEWQRHAGNLVLNTEDEPVGIYSLSSAVLLASEFKDLTEVDAFFASSEAVTKESVERNLWHRISTTTDNAEAERKLDRWLVKPTDGVFARMNRTVSIPISRQLIRFPITPNMVSLFVLGVSFSSGVLFARGGYLNTVAGALVSVAASILDGCDGEVARLKMQDSAFGCWLETVCDYLYYVFIFAGLTLGLMKSSGSGVWLEWGGILLFGAVMTFLATAFSRHRLAQRRPEELLRIWQRQAETRKSNALLFIGRRTEFLVRRCFLPYALLAFAVLNLTKLVFVLCAVGSNVAWIVSLYSCFVFSASRRRVAIAPTPAAAN